MASNLMPPYTPFPTTLQFHQGVTRGEVVRGIMGPFGSGKSVAVVNELVYIGMRQEPAPDGNRYVRFGIIRASYPNLKTSTKKTMEMWLPPECGRIKESTPMEGKYVLPWQGTELHIELLLLSCEDEEDAKKLRSTDFTAIWINEGTEVVREVFTSATDRIGRYPSGNKGKCTYSGIIIDYNKPPRGHWLTEVFNEQTMPDNYGYYQQPPAVFKHTSDDGIVTYTVNNKCENLENHSKGVAYYQSMVDSRTMVGDFDGIDQHLALLEVESKEGRPVWPTFTRDLHVAKSIIQPVDGSDLVIGIDTSGIHPSAVFLEYIDRNWVVLDELYAEGVGFKTFVDSVLLPVVTTRYSRVSSLVAVCDPANARGSYIAITPTEVLEEVGIPTILAPTNDPQLRIEGVSQMFNKTFGGLLISPNCELLITACAGAYRYRKLKVRGTVDAMYSDSPEKNTHSHIADALQYGVLYVSGRSKLADTSGVRARCSERLRNRRRVGL